MKTLLLAVLLLPGCALGDAMQAARINRAFAEATPLHAWAWAANPANADASARRPYQAPPVP